jgi:hypothetical protein
MADQQHPITPPSEMMDQWCMDFYELGSWRDIATKAAQWGADQELEACCEVLARELICDGKHIATDLRMIRRPKPPSLKEQALAVLEEEPEDAKELIVFDTDQVKIIRRALEALDD